MFPSTPLGRASTYHKIRDRESYAFALASAAVALRIGRGHGARSADRARRCGDAAMAGARGRARALGRTLTTESARAAGAAAFATAVAGRDNGYKIELGARTVADALDDRRRESECAMSAATRHPDIRPRRRARQGAAGAQYAADNIPPNWPTRCSRWPPSARGQSSHIDTTAARVGRRRPARADARGFRRA